MYGPMYVDAHRGRKQSQIPLNQGGSQTVISCLALVLGPALGPLQEQCMFLTTEPSLQLQRIDEPVCHLLTGSPVSQVTAGDTYHLLHRQPRDFLHAAFALT